MPTFCEVADNGTLDSDFFVAYDESNSYAFDFATTKLSLIPG